jgi:hypothetical protein
MASVIKVDSIQTDTGNIAFSTVASERLRIDNNGNVGIGTSSPGTQFNVYKSTATAVNIRPQNSLGYADFGPQADGSVYSPYASPAASTQLLAGTANSNPFTFYTNGTERMRIDSSGNVGIGTSSPTTYKSAKLAIRNDASSGEAVLAIINNSSNVYEGAGILLGSTAASTNYGATWLYHTYNTNSPTNTTSYAFNISQRATDGTYVSNIWNVDYQNSVTSWYRPNTSALQMQLDASNNLLFNSGYGSAAIAYGCRAWVNFNGTGTVAIRASGNVSSITDVAVAQYTVNFTTAMPDANYAPVGMAGYKDGTNNNEISWISLRRSSSSAFSTTACDITTGFTTSNAGSDVHYVNVAFFR